MLNGKRIKGRRKELELTQQQVADFVGCSLRTIVRWEMGECEIRGTQLKRLSEVLKISMEELMND